MTGSERRDQIINQIKKSSIPVSGAQLAKEFDVSRQVIVQDIALIRAAGHEIISTNRGYLLNTPHSVNRIFKVNHTDEELEDELCTVVDLGGKVVNVMVNHRVYGHMEAEINITSRRKVMEFVEDIKRGKSKSSEKYYLQLSLSSDRGRFRRDTGSDRRGITAEKISGRSGRWIVIRQIFKRCNLDLSFRL